MDFFLLILFVLGIRYGSGYMMYICCICVCDLMVFVVGLKGGFWELSYWDMYELY